MVRAVRNEAFLDAARVRKMAGAGVPAALAMGMAMTILFFAMLGHFSGIEVRQLKPSDLDPVKVWMAAEDRVQRGWERTVKYYENLRVVYRNPDAVEGMDRSAAGSERR